MTREELLRMHQETCDKCRQIMSAKNADYSHGNSPFLNFRSSEILGVHPAKGLLIRVLDKIQRIKSYIDRGELSVKNESVEDAIEDVINYMILLKGMIQEDKENA
jgi:hypothetical protein